MFAACAAILQTAQKPDPSALVGTWIVDLRPTPESEPSESEMVITSVAEGKIEGTFYFSTMESGRLNSSWDTVHGAFVTRDGSAGYNTSFRWDNGVLKGTTHSLGRNFLSVWTAKRKPATLFE